MFDSNNVPIKNGSLVRIDGTIVKTAKIVVPDAELEEV